MSTTFKKVIKIDASSLSSSCCSLNWKRTIVDGYREKVSGASLIYGSAIHKYIDTMFKTGGNIPKSRDAMLEVFRKPKYTPPKYEHLADERHLMTTAYTYWENCISKDSKFQVLQLPNGDSATEVTFDFPFYEDDTYQVRLAGTMDRIGKIQNGIYCIRDFKTTSSYQVDKYLAEYKTSKQLRFYVLAMRIMSRLEPDSMLGRIGAGVVGAAIDGIFIKAKPSDNEYHSSEVFKYVDSELDEFEQVLANMITGFIDKLRTGYIRREGMVNGSCTAGFGCRFRGVCFAPEPVQQVILDRDFRVIVYDPLKFGETN